MTGTAGATTYTHSMDIDGGTTRTVGVTGSSLATTIGPVTVTADMFDEVMQLLYQLLVVLLLTVVITEV